MCQQAAEGPDSLPLAILVCHLRLSAILESNLRDKSFPHLAPSPSDALHLWRPFSECHHAAVTWHSDQVRSPTASSKRKLVDAVPSYPTRMSFRIMLRTGLRMSEALESRRADLRLG